MNICVFSDNIEFADVWIYIQIQWMTFNQIIVWFLDLYFDVLDQFQGQSSSIVQVSFHLDSKAVKVIWTENLLVPPVGSAAGR